jgi:hypothetical protein
MTTQRRITVALLVVGVGGWLAVETLMPITLDNMRWHLTFTGLAAVLVGLGLSRLPWGREG